MSKHAAEQGLSQAFVELRRARLLDAVGRDLRPAGDGATPLPEDRLQHLLRDAEELYWNELSWEELTDEERIPGGHLTELVFPGFLAFVDGLLVERVPADALAPARPHPDAVEEILAFLGERFAAYSAELEGGADSESVVWARAMTIGLIDLVLYRLYRLTLQEREEIEALG